jgi:hypothetical protein
VALFTLLGLSMHRFKNKPADGGSPGSGEEVTK